MQKFDDLFKEAERQLNVCNSCRYCAGYCPVWPALELRRGLTNGDITHLSNLCHDCRDCFTACMYTAPHEFELNPPRVFAEVREKTYEEYARPAFVAPVARSRHFWWAAPLVATLVLLGFSLLTRGPAALLGEHGSSPYDLIGHDALVALFTIPSLFAVGVVLWGMWDYWKDINGGSTAGLFDLRAWGKTFSLASRLKHQSGGEEGCNYETEDPSRHRKIAHQLIMYGYLLTFVSTTSAAFIQTFLGIMPPYAYFSVPVITGTVGGIMACVGCVWAWQLKKASNKEMASPTMLRADFAFIGVSFLIQFSGLLVLATRTTPAFGAVLLAHLAIVAAAFVVAPYTKFVHWIYRLLSIQKDVIETRAPQTVTAG